MIRGVIVEKKNKNIHIPWMMKRKLMEEVERKREGRKKERNFEFDDRMVKAMYSDSRLVNEACKRAEEDRGKAPSARTDLGCIASGHDGADQGGVNQGSSCMMHTYNIYNMQGPWRHQPA